MPRRLFCFEAQRRCGLLEVSRLRFNYSESFREQGGVPGNSEVGGGEQRASARRQEVVAAAGGRNVSATSWSAASRRCRSNGFGKMAIAPDAAASSEGDQPVTRMTRAAGSLERMLRQAVAPF